MLEQPASTMTANNDNKADLKAFMTIPAVLNSAIVRCLTTDEQPLRTEVPGFSRFSL
jgi:hypothetical protein